MFYIFVLYDCNKKKKKYYKTNRSWFFLNWSQRSYKSSYNLYTWFMEKQNWNHFMQWNFHFIQVPSILQVGKNSVLPFSLHCSNTIDFKIENSYIANFVLVTSSSYVKGFPKMQRESLCVRTFRLCEIWRCSKFWNLKLFLPVPCEEIRNFCV